MSPEPKWCAYTVFLSHSGEKPPTSLEIEAALEKMGGVYPVTASHECEPCARFGHWHPDGSPCEANLRLRFQDFGKRLTRDVPLTPAAIESIALEAERTVNGPRQRDYGHPLDNWSRTAALWSPILAVPVTAEQALLCMVQVKVARLLTTPDHRDSSVDIAGYALTHRKAIEERKRRKEELYYLPALTPEQHEHNRRLDQQKSKAGP